MGKLEIPAPTFNFAFWKILPKSEDNIFTMIFKTFHLGEVIGLLQGGEQEGCQFHRCSLKSCQAKIPIF